MGKEVFSDEEIKELQKMERKRQEFKLPADSVEFRKIAKEGGKIRDGETRTNAGSLQQFKEMLEKPATGVSLIRFLGGNTPQETEALKKFYEKMKCPECKTPLLKTGAHGIWRCDNCGEDYSVE